MPECQNPLQEELKAYLDGELAASRRGAVEKHLESCPTCQSELESLRRLSTQLTEALPATDPLPDALRARILAALPEKPAPRPLSFAFWRRPGPMATLGGALAMGCALVLWLRVPAEEKMVPSASVASAPAFEAAKPRTSAGAAPAAQTERDSTRYNTAAPVAEPVSSPAPAEEKRAQQAPVAAAKPSPPKQPEPKPPAAPMRGAASPEAHVTYDNPLPSPPAVKAEAASSSAALANRSRALEALSPTFGEDAMKKDKSAEGVAMADAAAKRLARPAPPATLGAAVPAPPPPLSYTLTVPAGKQAEVTEAVRKLAEELTLPVLSEKPELQLALAGEQREALLERLKALGKLTETPVAVTRDMTSPSAIRFRGGSGGLGGRGAGGGLTVPGAAGVAKPLPPLRFTLVIKEAEHQEAP